MTWSAAFSFAFTAMVFVTVGVFSLSVYIWISRKPIPRDPELRPLSRPQTRALPNRSPRPQPRPTVYRQNVYYVRRDNFIRSPTLEPMNNQFDQAYRPHLPQSGGSQHVYDVPGMPTPPPPPAYNADIGPRSPRAPREVVHGATPRPSFHGPLPSYAATVTEDLEDEQPLRGGALFKDEDDEKDKVQITHHEIASNSGHDWHDSGGDHTHDATSLEIDSASLSDHAESEPSSVFPIVPMARRYTKSDLKPRWVFGNGTPACTSAPTSLADDDHQISEHLLNLHYPECLNYSTACTQCEDEMSLSAITRYPRHANLASIFDTDRAMLATAEEDFMADNPREKAALYAHAEHLLLTGELHARPVVAYGYPSIFVVLPSALSDHDSIRPPGRPQPDRPAPRQHVDDLTTTHIKHDGLQSDLQHRECQDFATACWECRSARSHSPIDNKPGFSLLNLDRLSKYEWDHFFVAIGKAMLATAYEEQEWHAELVQDAATLWFFGTLEEQPLINNGELPERISRIIHDSRKENTELQCDSTPFPRPVRCTCSLHDEPHRDMRADAAILWNTGRLPALPAMTDDEMPELVRLRIQYLRQMDIVLLMLDKLDAVVRTIPYYLRKMQIDLFEEERRPMPEWLVKLDTSIFEFEHDLPATESQQLEKLAELYTIYDWRLLGKDNPKIGNCMKLKAFQERPRRMLRGKVETPKRKAKATRWPQGLHSSLRFADEEDDHLSWSEHGSDGDTTTMEMCHSGNSSSYVEEAGTEGLQSFSTTKPGLTLLGRRVFRVKKWTPRSLTRSRKNLYQGLLRSPEIDHSDMQPRNTKAIQYPPEPATNTTLRGGGNDLSLSRLQTEWARIPYLLDNFDAELVPGPRLLHYEHLQRKRKAERLVSWKKRRGAKLNPWRWRIPTHWDEHFVDQWDMVAWNRGKSNTVGWNRRDRYARGALRGERSTWMRKKMFWDGRIMRYAYANTRDPPQKLVRRRPWTRGARHKCVKEELTGSLSGMRGVEFIEGLGDMRGGALSSDEEEEIQSLLDRVDGQRSRGPMPLPASANSMPSSLSRPEGETELAHRDLIEHHPDCRLGACSPFCRAIITIPTKASHFRQLTEENLDAFDQHLKGLLLAHSTEVDPSGTSFSGSLPHSRRIVEMNRQRGLHLHTALTEADYVINAYSAPEGMDVYSESPASRSSFRRLKGDRPGQAREREIPRMLSLLPQSLPKRLWNDGWPGGAVDAGYYEDSPESSPDEDGLRGGALEMPSNGVNGWVFDKGTIRRLRAAEAKDSLCTGFVQGILDEKRCEMPGSPPLTPTLDQEFSKITLTTQEAAFVPNLETSPPPSKISSLIGSESETTAPPPTKFNPYVVWPAWARYDPPQSPYDSPTCDHTGRWRRPVDGCLLMEILSLLPETGLFRQSPDGTIARIDVEDQTRDERIKALKWMRTRKALPLEWENYPELYGDVRVRALRGGAMEYPKSGPSAVHFEGGTRWSFTCCGGRVKVLDSPLFSPIRIHPQVSSPISRPAPRLPQRKPKGHSPLNGPRDNDPQYYSRPVNAKLLRRKLKGLSKTFRWFRDKDGMIVRVEVLEERIRALRAETREAEVDLRGGGGDEEEIALLSPKSSDDDDEEGGVSLFPLSPPKSQKGESGKEKVMVDEMELEDLEEETDRLLAQEKTAKRKVEYWQRVNNAATRSRRCAQLRPMGYRQPQPMVVEAAAGLDDDSDSDTHSSSDDSDCDVDIGRDSDLENMPSISIYEVDTSNISSSVTRIYERAIDAAPPTPYPINHNADIEASSAIYSPSQSTTSTSPPSTPPSPFPSRGMWVLVHPQVTRLLVAETRYSRTLLSKNCGLLRMRDDWMKDAPHSMRYMTSPAGFRHELQREKVWESEVARMESWEGKGSLREFGCETDPEEGERDGKVWMTNNVQVMGLSRPSGHVVPGETEMGRARKARKRDLAGVGGEKKPERSEELRRRAERLGRLMRGIYEVGREVCKRKRRRCGKREGEGKERRREWKGLRETEMGC